MCYSLSPKPADALYGHMRLTAKGRKSRLANKFLPAMLFKRITAENHDILHYHGDDYLCKGSSRRVRTFYGSAFFEARFAVKPPRFIYQALFYAFEWISCLRRGKKTAISHITTRALPLVKRVVPCGVPLGRYFPGGEKTPHPSLLFIGDLDSRKRGRLLVDVFVNRITPSHPQATLTIVGPQKYAAPGVVCTGKLAEEALIEEYRKAWIYCSASSYEGFGVPLIEAMACGTAVVALRAAGAREIISHGYNGLLCTDKELPGTLARLIADPALRTELAGHGLQTVRKYDIFTVAQRYRKIYHEK
jgi:phosphatidyl-myo-inositol alpha-mannosyltransferase